MYSRSHFDLNKKLLGRDCQMTSSKMPILTTRKHHRQGNQSGSKFLNTTWYLFQSIWLSRKQLLCSVKLPKFSLFAMVLSNVTLEQSTVPWTPGIVICWSCFVDCFCQIEMWLLPSTRLAFYDCFFGGIFCLKKSLH